METTNKREQSGTRSGYAERRGVRTDVQICKTDVQKIIKYFDDAAKVYDTLPGQRNNCRAWVIRQMIKKLEKKCRANDSKTKLVSVLPNAADIAQ